MKNVIILLLLLPVWTYGQLNKTDTNGLKQGLWQKKQSNGRLIYEGQFKDNKPVGEWKRYHPGGQLKAIMEYSGDTAKTQLFDVWRKKVAEGNYVQQKKEGIWKIYKQGRVVADEEFRNGEKNGLSHRFYETGEVMEETVWKQGNKNGKYQVFYKNGEPYMQCKMKDNMRNGLFLVYFENGSQQLIGEYKNDLRHGEWKYQTEEGKTQYTLFYNEGQILNPSVRDSIDNLKMQELEKNKGTIVDPGEFMEDPSEYMRKNKIFR